MRADSFIRTQWQPWVLGAARWPTLISCSPEWWSPGSPGYCRLSRVGAWLVWKMNTLTRAEVWSCTSSDMFISRWHTGRKGHHKSDILKGSNNIYAQIVCWWDHVEMVLIKLAYKWLPIYRQPKMPRLFTKCCLLALFLPFNISDQILFCFVLFCALLYAHLTIGAACLHFTSQILCFNSDGIFLYESWDHTSSYYGFESVWALLCKYNWLFILLVKTESLEKLQSQSFP